MSLNTKKGIYGVIASLAPIIGTACGLLGAFMVGIANMFEPPKSEWNSADLARNAVHFTKENAQRLYIDENILYVILLVFAFIAAIVGLSILTGQFYRDEDGNIKLNWFDRMWTEFHILLLTFASTGAIALAFPIVGILPSFNWFDVYVPLQPDEFVFGIGNKNIMILCIAGMLICIEIAILSWVTMVKKIKARKFLGTALLGKAVRALIRGVQNIWDKTTLPDDNEGNASRQLRLKYIAIPIAMVFLAMTWFGAIVDIVIILAVVPNKIKKYLDIRKGVAEVKAGNLNYQIITLKNLRNGEALTDFDKLAEDINQITTATNTAVQNELKNQRMKTDLISNVSHDLKTPLTSMISYLDILKKEGLDSPNAEEYLNIVDEKTQKLKTLTEDLFEAAKASSGNIPCDITTIDLAAMIEQELAEMGDLLQEKNLEIIKTIKVDNTNVQADGRLLSRVIENLLGNVSKYALENSRVYIDMISAGNNRIRLDIKNISRDSLNISPEELMERFTRGDDSRNTEGSGLGLAIAKDLTRLMGGIFEITIDGDMFKASVMF